MFRSTGRLALVPMLLVGCADVNNVVGGACADGYVPQGNTCVPAPTAIHDDGGTTTDDGSTDPQGDGGIPGDRDASATPDSGSTVISSTNPGFTDCFVPDIACSGVCVDPTSDPNNCGSCGHVCPSNSCVASKCVGSAPGHVVVIGHDYQVAPSASSSQARVLTNATLLPLSNPLRVMSYEQYADGTAVKNAESLVSAEAKLLGRTVSFAATTSSSTVSGSIDVNNYDVLIVHDQKNAPTGTLATIGSSWGSSGTLATFLHAGGVIVVLTGGQGTAEMPSLASNASLLTVNAQTSTTGALSVLAPADAIGAGVIGPYIPKANTVTLDTETNGGDVVWVIGQSGSPVVVHKVMP